MPLTIKICGINSKNIIQTIIQSGGCQYLGFVFYPPSPRNLSIEESKKLTSIVPNYIKKVAVLVKPKNSSDSDGFIASGAEAKMLRENFPKHILFTPGVRLPGDNQHDQKRVVTPAESLKFSDKVIMGRSLLQGDVGKNLEKVLNSIK